MGRGKWMVAATGTLILVIGAAMANDGFETKPNSGRTRRGLSSASGNHRPNLECFSPVSRNDVVPDDFEPIAQEGKQESAGTRRSVPPEFFGLTAAPGNPRGVFAGEKPGASVSANAPSADLGQGSTHARRRSRTHRGSRSGVGQSDYDSRRDGNAAPVRQVDSIEPFDTGDAGHSDDENPFEFELADPGYYEDPPTEFETSLDDDNTINDPVENERSPFDIPGSPKRAYSEEEPSDSFGPGTARHSNGASEDRYAVPFATGTQTSGPQTPMVTFEWIRKAPFSVNQECRCDLVVRNSGNITAGNVILEAYVPQHVDLVDSQPAPFDSSDRFAWSLGELEPGDTRTVQLTVMPQRPGEVKLSAFVRFSGVSTATFSAEEPMLAIDLQGPMEVLVGESATQIIRVSNPGSGAAQNISIQTLLPPGLEHRSGERLVMDIGALQPGEVRDVRLVLMAIEGGPQQIQVRAVSASGLNESIEAKVNVVAPELVVTIDGPDVRYQGLTGTFELLISNEGIGESNNVRAKYRVPAEFDYISADHGGQYNEVDETVTWFAGRIGPGESRRYRVTLEAIEAGDCIHQGGVISELGATDVTQFASRIEGNASLSAEIVRQGNRIGIGVEDIWEIRVRNDGTRAADNVGLSCELPSGLDLVGARGPSDHIVQNGLLVFKSLPVLPAGKTAIYELYITGSRAGSHRFRARVASDSSQQVVIAEEFVQVVGE